MLRQILATCDASARGRRDRALLLFGFAGALRRSELVALRVEDVVIVGGGLRLRIRRGKTDQTGQEAEIGLPRGRYGETCPVRAFAAWQAWPLTDDVLDHFLSVLTNGKMTTDGVGAHNDLLASFPYVGPPHLVAAAQPASWQRWRKA